MNSFYLFLIFAIFFININKIQSQLKIIDLSENLDKIPIESDGLSCNFNFSILVLYQGQSFSLTFDQVVSDYTKVVDNSTASLYSFYFTNVPLGNSSITVTVSSSSMTSYNKTINYSCNEIDYNNLDIKILTNYNDKRYSSTIYNFIQIKNYKFNLLKLNTNDPYTTISNFGNNIFSVSINKPITNYLIQSNKIQLLFQNGLLDVVLPSPYVYVENKIIKTTLYQNQINLFEEIGNNYTPLYKILSSSNKYTPVYRINENKQSYPIAIYGPDKSNITFLGTIPSIYSNQDIILYNLNGTTFDPIINMNYNIKNKIFKSGIPEVLNNPNIDNSIIDSLMYTIYYDSNDYDFINFIYGFGDSKKVELGFPFGFNSGSTSDYTFKVSFISTQRELKTQTTYSITPLIANSNSSKGVFLSAQDVSISQIQLTSFESFYLYGFSYLLRFTTTSNYLLNPIGNIAILNKNYGGYENCISNENENSVFEIIIDAIDEYTGIEITSSIGFKQFFSINNFVSINPPIKPTIEFKLFEDYNILNITYLINDLDVTNKNVSNIMYLKFPTNESNYNFGLVLNAHKFDKDSDDEIFYSKWNQEKQLYEIEFIVKSNIQHGIVPWHLKQANSKFIIFNSIFDTSFQLRVNESKFDIYGPVFTKFSKSSLSSQSPFSLHFEFEIEDLINGFDRGYIQVRGNIDGSVFRSEIICTGVVEGDIFIGKYITEIVVSIDYCYQQNYTITNIELFDTQRRKSIFDINSNENDNALANPFVNFLNDPFINQMNMDCASSNDYSPPELNSFSFDNQIESSDSKLIFSFTATDNESGIKRLQYPIVYASNNQLKTVQCISDVLDWSLFTVNYRCIMNIPRGFGFGSSLLFSVYGFINNAGLFSGFPAETLKDLGFDYYLTDIKMYRNVLIEKTSEITSNGGELWIIGQEFTSNHKIYIKYLDGTNQISVPVKTFSTLILINDVKPSKDQFYIKAVFSNISESNEFIVSPNILPPLPTILPTPPINPSNEPTKPPQTCLNNCGGPEKGYCSSYGKCICFSPNIGDDCTSKVIIVPKPTTNVTNPTINITIPTNNGSDVIFKSIISLYSIRELDYNSNKVCEYIFDKWYYTEINSTTNHYITNITVMGDDGIKTTTTTIKATLQWYSDETNITFANQPLTMSPSSIKFTIEISKYRFSNQLNQLQLLILSSFDSSKNNDICSSKQFNGDDSLDYLKLHVGDHSLYGRFIKRAIIDSSIISVSNQIITNMIYDSVSASTSISYIGITIPHVYNDNIIIDPDFKVLLDTRETNNNDENSICKSSSSKLTTSQLAGIIIGSIAFATIITICLVYYFTKRNQIKKMNIKLKMRFSEK